MNKWRKPFSILLTVIAVVAVSGVTWLASIAHAAGGQLYTTVGATTVAPSGTVTVNVRINPSTATDTVNVNLSYDTSKMTYSNISYAGSPFDQHFGLSTSGGHVSFAAAMLGTSVSSDSFIATVTFTAAAETTTSPAGVATFALTGSNAAYSGVATDPTFGAASNVTFVCAAGKTGTPPTCTTPTTGGGGGGTTTTPPKTTTTTPAPAKAAATSNSSGGTGTTKTATTKPIGVPATVTGTNVQYTKASITCTTKTASTAYVRYGIDGNLNTSTPVSASATSHTIALDPAVLLPGETYSYVVVSTDASGTTSQTAVQTFKTKGLQITLTVLDKNNKPLKGKTVTLHSTPATAKTDDKGNVTFTDVAPGSHQVIYAAGKKTYTQQVSVVNDIQTVGETQTAEPQSFSVVYGFAQSSLNMAWIWLAGFILIIGVLVALGRSGRLGFAMQLRSHNYGTPLAAQPVVVGSNTSSPHEVTSGSSMSDSERAAVQEHLNAIPNPQTPLPGTSVTPKDDSDSHSQSGGQE